MTEAPCPHCDYVAKGADEKAAERSLSIHRGMRHGRVRSASFRQRFGFEQLTDEQLPWRLRRYREGRNVNTAQLLRLLSEQVRAERGEVA